jgi:hypothetical protein
MARWRLLRNVPSLVGVRHGPRTLRGNTVDQIRPHFGWWNTRNGAHVCLQQLGIEGMSATVAPWTRPKSVDLATIRCPACGWIFTRVLGTIEPPKGEPFVEIEAVCQDRRCRKQFRVRVGIVAC